jgi:hypothetical protein
MPTDHDPRSDPHPGDVLRFGSHPCTRTYIEVKERDPRLNDTDVSYWDEYERSCSIGQWRVRMRRAEVIYRGG